jgi:hypothetical protein
MVKLKTHRTLIKNDKNIQIKTKKTESEILITLVTTMYLSA